jgi:hypothetical protein
MDDIPNFHAAPGVEYREQPGIPGRYFDCSVMHAVLTPQTCAKNFLASKVLIDGRYASCHRCPIGRAHAGDAAGPAPVDVGWRCCRCGTSGQRRLVGGAACVSCYNRSREVVRLKDGRGSIPTGLMADFFPGWAVVGELPPVDEGKPVMQALRLDTVRRVLAATPGLYRISKGRFLLVALVKSQEELQRTVRRKLPGVAVLASGIEPSLLEFHEAGIDPNEWLRAGVC